MSDRVSVPRSVVEELVGRKWPMGDAALLADLHAALAEDHDSTGGASPPWHLAANAVRQLRQLRAERGVKGQADLDQLQATIREQLDELEVSVHDPAAIFHGFVWTGLVVEIARYGYSNGRVDGDTFSAIGEISHTIASALLDYVPAEVGR